MDDAARVNLGEALARPTPRWPAEAAAGKTEAELLVLRSNLLGADLAVTNFGGGNTSAKLEEPDPITGAPVQVLWVKGSGGDLGSIAAGGFSRLRMATLDALAPRFGGSADEDLMPGLYPYAAIEPGGRAPSIDTPLHALLPFRHIDHVHPDAVIALAAASGGEAAAREIYGDAVGWTPWLRPGFELAQRLRALVDARPDLRGAIMAGHGLIAWGETSEACCANTLDLIGRAADYLNHRLARAPAFGGEKVARLPAAERATAAAALAPLLRALAGDAPRKILHFDDSPETLEFVGSHDAARLAELGTSCPDHFLRTKIKPLLLDPARLERDGGAYLAAAFEAYRADYAAYYERCRRPASPPMRDANPVVVLHPKVGMFALARDKATARIASEFYRNAINVMRGAEAVGGYLGLPEQEAFDIEYWALEEAKLRRMPPPAPLEGRIALITGGAGGIGRATAERLLADGACVVLADIDLAALAAAEQDLAARYGADRVRRTAMDVTDEAAVVAGLAFVAREFGGLDILVANAGIASAAPIEETTLAIWRRNHDILAEGYFLVSREAFKLMKGEDGKGLGGSIVFVGSKNALAASVNASAYASAKAAAVHLARCLALEGAPHGIRVNVVNPDAVLRGSRIWSGDWRQERAAAYGVDPGPELEAHYRDRSLLKREVLPEDVAEAVAFFASERSAKSTGNMLNVDAGNAQAFTR
ncbi:MAG TPA: bifunctional rhamnulose-1-phosphate aldolase/short-chain dehydrogenase [Caulobacteraceae bacterium]|jgi:rhamnulose-1-phosphate aldolase/alcohol dehydrogenase